MKPDNNNQNEQRKTSILVIDDNATNLRVISDYLRDGGYRVLVAQDGPGGLEKARYVHPDLILLDIMMPDMDGFEVCRRLKADKQLKSIPVIFMTALSDVQNKVRAFEAGGIDYIVKPFQPVEVLARVRIHLNLRELTEQLEQKVCEKTVELSRTVEQLHREIEERKRVEDERLQLLRNAQQSNMELRSIVDISSHDLQSPIVNIQGFSGELALKCKKIHDLVMNTEKAHDVADELIRLVDNEIPNTLNYIQFSTLKMKKLIDGLYEFSQINTIHLTNKTLEMNALIEPIHQVMLRKYSQTDLEFECQLLPACLGDGVQVVRIFTHLIDNAVKYRSPNRRLQVRISGTVDGQWACYRVQDNGIGIREKFHQKIFEIFHQLNPEKEQESVGLGLTICQSLLYRLHGQINVESEPDRGAAFIVSLPRP